MRLTDPAARERAAQERADHMAHFKELAERSNRPRISDIALRTMVTGLRDEYLAYGQPVVSEAELTHHAIVTILAERKQLRPEEQPPIIQTGGF
jgi:hypothetical protein